MERRLVACFTNGDMGEYHQLIDNIVEGKETFVLGNVSDDRMLQLKYAFITFGALAVRASISGGMDELKAYEYSDAYIRFVDKAKNVSEFQPAFNVLEHLMEQMVQIHQSERGSRAVRLCKNYIGSHLHEKITREQLAAVCTLTPSYLSSLFKKENGVSIHQYILLQRVDRAEQILRSEPMPDFSKLSYQLGFSSQSHFISVFRKVTGLTPLEYRNQALRRPASYPNVTGQAVYSKGY